LSFSSTGHELAEELLLEEVDDDDEPPFELLHIPSRVHSILESPELDELPPEPPIGGPQTPK
jgi:hypothetical protein